MLQLSETGHDAKFPGFGGLGAHDFDGIVIVPLRFGIVGRLRGEKGVASTNRTNLQRSNEAPNSRTERS